MMKQIDQQGLIDILEGKTAHQFVSVESETTPKCNQSGRETGLTIYNKIGCSPKSVVKVSSFVCMLGLNYKNIIENRLGKEGKDASEYVKGESWHIPYGDTKNIRQHRESGELYVYLFMVANNKPTSAFYDMEHGRMIDKADLAEFLPKEYAPKNQGLTEGNEVNVRTFKLSSIRKIKIDGEEFSVR